MKRGAWERGKPAQRPAQCKTWNLWLPANLDGVCRKHQLSLPLEPVIPAYGTFVRGLTELQ